MPETGTERPTLERLLQAIGRETGLTARVLEWEPRLAWQTAVRPDALAEIHAPRQAEQSAVEITHAVRCGSARRAQILFSAARDTLAASTVIIGSDQTRS